MADPIKIKSVWGSDKQPAPGGPFYVMRRIPVFKPGTWNDEPFDLAFVKTLADNFDKFCTGPNPWYRPFLTFNHQQTPALSEARFGRLTRCSVDDSGQMYLDAEDIPEEIAHLVNARMFPECSIEFVRPKRDAAGKVESGFIGPDGSIVEGPVVKCLTLLGNDLPAVRGMDPVPLAVPADRPADRFAFTGGIVSRFSQSFGVRAMETREQMIEALKGFGVDVSSLTDAVPDEFLASVLKAWRDANATQNPPAADVDPNAGTAVMADMAAAANAGLVAPAGATTMAADGRMPSQIIHKFAQANPGILSTILRTVGNVRTVVIDQQREALDKLKDDAITAFFAEMSASGQITPKMQDGVRKLLKPLDNVAVSKFSVDGGKEQTGTALAEAMAKIRADYPVVKPMGHQTRQNTPPGPGTAGNTNGGTGPSDRVKSILGGSGNAVGRAALAKAGIK